jgi:hypothetical protein
MRMSVLARLGIGAGAVLLAIAGTVGGSGSPARAAAPAAAAAPATVAAPAAAAAPTSYVTNGYLTSVAAVSASDAWAVGSRTVKGGGQNVLILHWNGRKWSPVANIRPVWGWLDSVSAVSASNIWAVGEYTPSGKDHRVLIMHWNGKSWSQAGGVPSVIGTLYGVSANAGTVWAVGTIQVNAGHEPSLIMHLTGGHWYVVPAPVPISADGDAVLDGVVLGTHGTAWAIGTADNGEGYNVLLRWNGATWKSVASPMSGEVGGLPFGLAAVPSGNVWVVGWDNDNDGAGSMVWNGSTWRKVPVPTWASCTFYAVASVPGSVWAVGAGGVHGGNGALLYRWTGKSWTRFSGPSLGAEGRLDGVAGTSAASVWAVGSSWSPPKSEQTVILHWNGKAWS